MRSCRDEGLIWGLCDRFIMDAPRDTFGHNAKFHRKLPAIREG